MFNWYQHIATAFESLREEFLEMNQQRLTPTEFGLRVMAHPDMMATNAMKMRYSETVSLTYRATLTETSTFPADRQTLSANYDVTENFITTLGPATHNDLERIIWRDVSVDSVIEFMESYQTYKSSPQANSRRIATYIRKQKDKAAPELLLWNVSLVTLGRKDHNDGIPFAGYALKQISRSLKRPSDSSLFIRRLVDKKDELQDFSEADRQRFRDEKISNQQTRKEGIRLTHPLLSIYLLTIEDKEFGSNLSFTKTPVGFAISWPDSKTLSEITYSINTVAQELDITDDED